MYRRALALCLAAAPGCVALPSRAPAPSPWPPSAYAPPYAQAPPDAPPPASPPGSPYAPGPPPGPFSRTSAAIAFARAQVGKPYCRGGEGPRCFDCSGLVQAAWAWGGVRLPRTSDDQARSLEQVSPRQLRPGDVLWWPGHVALYVGGGEVIDARGARIGVVRRPLQRAPALVLRPRGEGSFASVE